MKVIMMIAIVFSMCVTTACAGFDDFLKEVLVETTTSSQTIGSNEYIFSPGDVVIKKDTYAVYYAGSELTGTTRMLRLVMMTSQGSILLTYPNPTQIRVKDYRFNVINFDNMSLKVKMLE